MDTNSYQCECCFKVWSSNTDGACVECGGKLRKLVPVGTDNQGETIWGMEDD